MHAILQLLVDALLMVLLVGGFCAYQSYRRRQNEYARVQLYEDADRPFCGASTPEAGGWQGSMSTEYMRVALAIRPGARRSGIPRASRLSSVYAMAGADAGAKACLTMEPAPIVLIVHSTLAILRAIPLSTQTSDSTQV